MRADEFIGGKRDSSESKRARVNMATASFQMRFQRELARLFTCFERNLLQEEGGLAGAGSPFTVVSSTEPICSLHRAARAPLIYGRPRSTYSASASPEGFRYVKLIYYWSTVTSR
ncbi:hypothetical protein EVAR_66126_1 [Eumeta japonica]|uniref:Uncharacterized protein n=1 Tax=Eumeta variegata TaxID=151549 RepID=A0A4C1ZW03_EUMVA|nr:hypothetical protein EVAR_66126_1 [Eumeta japonica]